MIEFQNFYLKINNHVLLEDYSNQLKNTTTLIYGANGVGKTTLLNLIFKSKDLQLNTINTHKSSISYLLLNAQGLLPNYTGRDLISTFTRMKKSPQITNTISQSNIFQECLNKESQYYSNGMRQLFKYYLHTFWNPEILLIDEPFTFLDSYHSLLVKEDLNQRKRNTTIILTSQFKEHNGLKIDHMIELKV